MKISDKTRKILAPLSEHSSHVEDYRNTGGGLHMGHSDSNDPAARRMSHAEFVIEAVLPALEGACERFGQEKVAEEIVALTLQLYPNCPPNVVYNHPACFLSSTLRGDCKNENISPDLTNPRLAEKYGLTYVFSPIVQLGIVHQVTNVFSASKFFGYHACRMGEMIDNFSNQDYLAYIDFCKALLRNNTYDWSMENNPEEWGMLRPSIRLYGLEAVFKPMVQAMLDIAHLPGTKDRKYKFSFLHFPMQALYPIMLPPVRKSGVGEMDKFLRQIVDFVLDLSKEGAFTVDHACHQSAEGKFFHALAGEHLETIKSTGVQQVLKLIRAPWREKLLQSALSTQ